MFACKESKKTDSEAEWQLDAVNVGESKRFRFHGRDPGRYRFRMWHGSS